MARLEIHELLAKVPDRIKITTAAAIVFAVIFGLGVQATPEVPIAAGVAGGALLGAAFANFFVGDRSTTEDHAAITEALKQKKLS